MTSTGKRNGIRWIQKMVKWLGKEVRLKTALHPHWFRHTFATELLSKGAELSFIAEELGHASLDTTRIYAQSTKKDIITIYGKYMG